MTFVRLSFGSIAWEGLFLFFSVGEILVGAFVPQGSEFLEPSGVSRGEVLVFTAIFAEIVEFPSVFT